MRVMPAVIAAVVLLAAAVRARGTPIRPVRFYSALAMLTALLAGSAAYALGGGPAATTLLIAGLVAAAAGLCTLAEVSGRRRRGRPRKGRGRRRVGPGPVRPGR